MNKSIFEPVPIVIQAERKQQQEFVFYEEKLSFSSKEEYLHYVTHKVNNKKQIDGRIYYKMDNGQLTANSVSPYAEKFWTNIEPGVEELVKGLIKKRYLTYSSCEGHGPTFRRYVGLAFADEESREYVAKKINELKLWGVFTRNFDSVSNVKAKPNEKTFKPEMSKLSEKERVLISDEEIFSFNIEFHRNYEKYFFLEIIITDVILYEKESFVKEIKKYFLKLYKKYFCDYLTRKVVLMINSKEFKKYPY